MNKLLAQAQTMLHHAHMVDLAINQKQEFDHTTLARYAGKGLWESYFSYASSEGIEIPEEAYANGMILVFK